MQCTCGSDTFVYVSHQCPRCGYWWQSLHDAATRCAVHAPDAPDFVEALCDECLGEDDVEAVS